MKPVVIRPPPPDLLRFEVDDALCAELVFELLALTSAATADAAAGIEAAHAAFVTEHGSALSHFQLNDSTRMRKFNAKARAMVPTWMKDPASLAQPLLGVQVHSGPTADEFEAPDFSFFQDQSADDVCGYLRLSVPFDAVGGIDDAVELLSMLESYPVSWGLGGFSVLWDPGGAESRDVKRWLRAPLIRYPGLGSGEPLAYMVRQHLGVMRVGWCTLVGDAHLGTLGGLEAVREQVAAVDGLELREIGAFAAIFAGSRLGAPPAGWVHRHGRLRPVRARDPERPPARSQHGPAALGGVARPSRRVRAGAEPRGAVEPDLPDTPPGDSHRVARSGGGVVTPRRASCSSGRVTPSGLRPTDDVRRAWAMRRVELEALSCPGRSRW